MPLIRFTDNIQRHVACPNRNVPGATAREALDSYFESNPRARGYVLDEQGALRTHIALFINSQPIRDRSTLADPLHDDATLDVMQALSGG